MFRLLLDNPLRQQAFLAMTVKNWEDMKDSDSGNFRTVTITAVHKTHLQHGFNVCGVSEVNEKLVSSFEFIENKIKISILSLYT
jgi:hypothetical protein